MRCGTSDIDLGLESSRRIRPPTKRCGVEVGPLPHLQRIRRVGKQLMTLPHPKETSRKGLTMTESSLYERLGGAFAIAAVIEHFSDAVVQNAIVGQKSEKPALREWHTKNLERLPGLKFMRTLWVCNVAGGPFQYTATKPGSTPIGLEEAHREFNITPTQFDEVAAELGRSLDVFKVPQREKAEVLAAFAAHKPGVTEGDGAARTAG